MCVSFFLFLFVCAAICTVVWKSQGLRCRYWPLPCPLSIRSFACTAYLFVFFALLASLASSAALIHLLACSLAHFAHSQACGKMHDFMSQYHTILNHSALTALRKSGEAVKNGLAEVEAQLAGFGLNLEAFEKQLEDLVNEFGFELAQNGEGKGVAR